jgi:hypothetical protein
VFTNDLMKNVGPVNSFFRAKKKSLLQAWTGPEASRRLRLLDFMTVGTRRWQGCQPYAPATIIPQEIFLVFISVRGWVDPGPQCGRKDDVNEKLQWHHRESNPRPSGLWRSASTNCTTACPPEERNTLKIRILSSGRNSQVCSCRVMAEICSLIVGLLTKLNQF